MSQAEKLELALLGDVLYGLSVSIAGGSGRGPEVADMLSAVAAAGSFGASGAGVSVAVVSGAAGAVSGAAATFSGAGVASGAFSAVVSAGADSVVGAAAASVVDVSSYSNRSSLMF